MPQSGIDQLYFGNEAWNIPDNSQSTGFQTFLQDFKTPTTRNTILNSSVYDDAAGKKNIVAFLSRESVKNLMGGAAGTTPRQDILGISILFGYDAANSKIVLIARSANGRAARPSRSEFTNFNFLSKSPSDTNANPGLSDAETNAFTASFRSDGYTYLTGLSSGTGVTVKFDNHVLARLLYSDVGPTPTFTGQSDIHLVIAPPWENASGQYLSLVCQGRDGNNAAVFRGVPPCPPYCYQAL